MLPLKEEIFRLKLNDEKQSALWKIEEENSQEENTACTKATTQGRSWYVGRN